MNASIKTFFAAHKTTIMIATAALVIGAKSFSSIGHNNEQPQQWQAMPEQPGGQQPGMGGQMPQGYRQQMPQQNQNGGGGYFDGWFGDNNQNENYGGYNGGNQNYGGYTGSGYSGANYYNPNAGSGADYTSNYWNQQAANDRNAEKFDDYINDQGNYSDGYGNTYKMSSNYNYNYVNTTTNEAIQSNDPNYDPNVYSSSTYTAVTPSDYSSSSYSSTTTTSSSSGDE